MVYIATHRDEAAMDGAFDRFVADARRTGNSKSEIQGFSAPLQNDGM